MSRLMLHVRSHERRQLLLAAIGAAFTVAASLGVSFSESDTLLVLILGGAAVLFSAVAVTLPSGEMLRVTGMVTVAAAALLGLHQAVIVMLMGSLLGRISARALSTERLTHHLVGALYSAALVGISALAWSGVREWAAWLGDSLALAVAPLVAGLLYSALDLLGSALLSTEKPSAGIRVVLGDLVRMTYRLYLGQVCLGVVAVLLWPSMREWSLALLAVLGLMMLYSFNLYLRVRSSYQETIRALGRVSELSLPALDGHAQRVSDMAVSVGRRLGCSPRELENLNYAALLHGVGRVGEEADSGLSPDAALQASRGAEIVERIPFLADTADLIRYQYSLPEADSGVSRRITKLAHVVGACSRYSIAYRIAIDSGESDPVAAALRGVMTDEMNTSDPELLTALAAEVGIAVTDL